MPGLVPWNNECRIGAHCFTTIETPKFDGLRAVDTIGIEHYSTKKYPIFHSFRKLDDARLKSQSNSLGILS